MVWLSFLPPTTTLSQTAAQARFKLPKVKSFKAEASNYLSYNLLSSLKNSCRQKSQGVPINLTMHYAFCACFNKIMTKYPKDFFLSVVGPEIFQCHFYLAAQFITSYLSTSRIPREPRIRQLNSQTITAASNTTAFHPFPIFIVLTREYYIFRMMRITCLIISFQISNEKSDPSHPAINSSWHEQSLKFKHFNEQKIYKRLIFNTDQLTSLFQNYQVHSLPHSPLHFKILKGNWRSNWRRSS